MQPSKSKDPHQKSTGAGQEVSAPRGSTHASPESTPLVDTEGMATEIKAYRPSMAKPKAGRGVRQNEARQSRRTLSSVSTKSDEKRKESGTGTAGPSSSNKLVEEDGEPVSNAALLLRPPHYLTTLAPGISPPQSNIVVLKKSYTHTLAAEVFGDTRWSCSLQIWL